MEPIDRGSKKSCQSPALPCRLVPGPSPASPRAHAAPGAPAPPTSAPFSQRRLSSSSSTCVSPGAKLTAGFHPGTETSSKIFPGLHDTCCCPGSARRRGLRQEAGLCLTEPAPACSRPSPAELSPRVELPVPSERAGASLHRLLTWSHLPACDNPRLPFSHPEPAFGCRRRRLCKEEERTAQAETGGALDPSHKGHPHCLLRFPLESTPSLPALCVFSPKKPSGPCTHILGCRGPSWAGSCSEAGDTVAPPLMELRHHCLVSDLVQVLDANLRGEGVMSVNCSKAPSVTHLSLCRHAQPWATLPRWPSLGTGALTAVLGACSSRTGCLTAVICKTSFPALSGSYCLLTAPPPHSPHLPWAQVLQRFGNSSGCSELPCTQDVGCPSPLPLVSH